MKVLKLVAVAAIAYGVWFQFVGNVYETGRWRLSEECGEISSDRVRAMWVSAEIALHDKERSLKINTFFLARNLYLRVYGSPTLEETRAATGSTTKGRFDDIYEELNITPTTLEEVTAAEKEREDKCIAWLLANSD